MIRGGGQALQFRRDHKFQGRANIMVGTRSFRNVTVRSISKPLHSTEWLGTFKDFFSRSTIFAMI